MTDERQQEDNSARKSSTKKKVVVMTITALYFVFGFFALVILLGRVINPNYAGLIGLVYLALGWYFLVKRRTLIHLMKH